MRRVQGLGRRRRLNPTDAVLLRWSRRKQLPRDPIKRALLRARYLAEKLQWRVPDEVQRLVNGREARSIYRLIRLECDHCEGYYTVRHTGADWRGKFFGCSTYHETGCKARLDPRDYAYLKRLTIYAVLTKGIAPARYRWIRIPQWWTSRLERSDPTPVPNGTRRNDRPTATRLAQAKNIRA